MRKPILKALLVASLAAAGMAQAHVVLPYVKNVHGRIADAMRIPVSLYDEAHPNGKYLSPTLTYRLGLPTGPEVVVTYADRDNEIANPELPAELQRLKSPEDVNFVQFDVLDTRTLGAKTFILVHKAPDVWAEKPDDARIEYPEINATSFIDLRNVSHVCLDAPTASEDCVHEPAVLQALTVYLAAQDTFERVLQRKIPGAELYGCGNRTAGDEEMYILHTEDPVIGPTPAGPYARIIEAQPRALDALEYWQNKELAKKLGEPNIFSRVLKRELEDLRIAEDGYRATLKGKRPVVRLRSADGTQTYAGDSGGC